VLQSVVEDLLIVPVAILEDVGVSPARQPLPQQSMGRANNLR
jgi:hypothetical protein